MDFMKRRAEKFRDLIGQGKFDSAIRRLENCYIHGMKNESKVAQLLVIAKLIDANLKKAADALKEAKDKKGEEQAALIRKALVDIQEFEKNVELIINLAREIVKAEKSVEKEERQIGRRRSFLGRLFGAT